jgi:hypothetical protein
MREVRVYDGDFPTFEQILAGDPTATFPREIWLQQVQPGEFAVRYKDFKTGLARNPAGKHVKSSEICRIFASVAEARANSREVVNGHWTVRCFIYDHNGAQVDTVSNNKEVGKAAAVMYAGILLWLGTFAIVGMGSLWILSELTFLAVGRHPSVQGPLFPLGWVGWTAYAIAGLLLGILVRYLRIEFIAKKRVDRLPQARAQRLARLRHNPVELLPRVHPLHAPRLHLLQKGQRVRPLRPRPVQP